MENLCLISVMLDGIEHDFFDLIRNLAPIQLDQLVAGAGADLRQQALCENDLSGFGGKSLRI